MVRTMFNGKAHASQGCRERNQLTIASTCRYLKALGASPFPAVFGNVNNKQLQSVIVISRGLEQVHSQSFFGNGK